MTERVGNILVISEEKPQQCDFCGKIRELRPYGQNKECICFDCGMKDIDATLARFYERLADTEGGVSAN